MNLHAIHSFIDSSFTWVWSNSLATIVLIILTSVLQLLFRKFLPARWLYALWFCVLLRLIVPILPQSSFSIFNLSNSILRVSVERSHGSPRTMEAMRERPTAPRATPHEPAKVSSAISPEAPSESDYPS